MKLFKTVSLRWWEIGLIKLSVVCIGIFIGVTWQEVFAPYAMHVLMVGLVAGIAMVLVWCKK